MLRFWAGLLLALVAWPGVQGFVGHFAFPAAHLRRKVQTSSVRPITAASISKSLSMRTQGEVIDKIFVQTFSNERSRNCLAFRDLIPLLHGDIYIFYIEICSHCGMVRNVAWSAKYEQ
jgi:hypothetical protein